ncbi:hypothetical protein [Ferruginibacter profundus]
MVRLLFILLSLTFVAHSKAQSPAISQTDIDLVNFAIKDKRHGIFLISEMTEYNLAEIKKFVDKGFFVLRLVDNNNKDVSDTVKLTSQDADSMYQKLHSLKTFKWTTEVAKKINLDHLSIIGPDTSSTVQPEYAIKYQIVPPIFFNNQTYGILCYSYSCGGLCGHGQITIYKKVSGAWQRWNNLMWWDE